MSVVGRRRHGASALGNYLIRSSNSSLVFLGRPSVSPGRPERNAGCPTVICSSRYMTIPIPFEVVNHFHDISVQSKLARNTVQKKLNWSRVTERNRGEHGVRVMQAFHHF